MTKKSKLLTRLYSKPADFEYSELRALLTGLGYEEIGGRGSRVKFFNRDLNSLINLHKPHPGNVVKQYHMHRIVAKLKEKGIEP